MWWIELIYALLLWIGLLAGFWLFIIRSLVKRLRVSTYAQQMFFVWAITVPMIGAVIIMTGASGCSRLRLPIEPLLIILSLTFWHWKTREYTQN